MDNSNKPKPDSPEKASIHIRELLQDGHKDQALKLLSKTFGESIYWQARRMVIVHEDAQDVLQETFVRIVKSIDSFKWESKLSSWIYRIVTNESIRLLDTRNKKLQTQNLDDITKVITSSDFVDLGDTAAIKLQAAIQKLPRKQQITFNMRYYDDLPYEEIAEILGSNVAAVKMNYHHAKEKILQILKENN